MFHGACHVIAFAQMRRAVCQRQLSVLYHTRQYWPYYGRFRLFSRRLCVVRPVHAHVRNVESLFSKKKYFPISNVLRRTNLKTLLWAVRTRSLQVSAQRSERAATRSESIHTKSRALRYVATKKKHFYAERTIFIYEYHHR